MITKKAKEIRKRITDHETRRPTKKESDELYDELIDNCKPTADEFDKMSSLLYLDGYCIFRLIMEAHENWKSE